MVLPPIAQKMSSYRYPTEDDIHMIGCAIAQDEQVIAAFNSEIKTIMAQLERVRLRKMEYQENIRQYRSLITLARRIPPEILADVFQLCAECGWTRAPLVASHVCSAWRKAAEYPRVWSRIYIDCSLGTALTRTKLWLSRARQSPLHITLDVPANLLSTEEILFVLFEHSMQWRNITIRTHDSAQLNHILSLMHHPFPELRRFNCLTHWETPAADLVDFSAVHDAPLLRQLDIELPNLPRWSIPFQLTDLHIVLSTSRVLSNPVPASRWASMLAKLPSLKHLTLDVSDNSEYHYEPDTVDVVELPQLESIVFMVTGELLGVFNNMRAAALRQLILRCSSGQHPSSGSVICQFLESSPRIELFELHDVDLPREELVQCFTLLPRLEELRLHDSDISDEELQLLYGPTGLCPDLVRLDVRWCVHLTGLALVQLVRSRIQISTEMMGKSEMTLQQAKEMKEVAAINCLHVMERDVLDLAEHTTCRLMLRTVDDFCRNKGCCTNGRYRQRMRLRHNIGFHERNPVLARIIL